MFVLSELRIPGGGGWRRVGWSSGVKVLIRGEIEVDGALRAGGLGSFEPVPVGPKEKRVIRGVLPYTVDIVVRRYLGLFVLVLPLCGVAQTANSQAVSTSSKQQIDALLSRLDARIRGLQLRLGLLGNGREAGDQQASTGEGQKAAVARKQLFSALAGSPDFDEFNEVVTGLQAATGNAFKQVECIALRVDQWKPARAEAGAAFQQSLAMVEALLERAPGPGEAACRDLECLQKLRISMAVAADDLAVKCEHCLLAGLAATVRTEVRTAKDLQVLYAPALAFAVMSREAAAFPRLTSPTEEDLAPGRYVLWARDPKTGKVSEPQTYKIGGGRKEIVIDLPWQ